MILVIGNPGCSRCEVIKTLLQTKNKEFTYIELETLSEEQKKIYIKMAKEAKQLSMPIIIQDNKVVNIKEVM